MPANQDETIPERGHARLNRTVAAMMQRGLNLRLSQRLHRDGVTISHLKQADDTRLMGLGLNAEQIAGVRKGARAVVPFSHLAQVLWANRFTCCVCRNPVLAVIVHHIQPWADSQDHSLSNLAVLCLEHHARAHRRGDLEQNLGPRQLVDFKTRWEAEVSHLDARAILEASRLEGHHWWWFNHTRVFEMAQRSNLDLRQNPYFASARARGWLDRDGLLCVSPTVSSYLYEGGDGMYLYAYVRGVVEAVLAATAVFNISDDLDPGFLSNVVSPGDIVLVEGKHLFKSQSSTVKGPGQASLVRREVNHVRVEFTVDRWEAVATSAWAVWLAGAKPASSIVRISSVERDGKKLLLRSTGLVMGSPLRGLSTRSYVFPTWPTREDDLDDEESDGWLDGFGEEVDLT
jgi:5-methylcytosine-specific restriction endonuclease McrA